MIKLEAHEHADSAGQSIIDLNLAKIIFICNKINHFLELPSRAKTIFFIILNMNQTVYNNGFPKLMGKEHLVLRRSSIALSTSRIDLKVDLEFKLPAKYINKPS